MGVHDTIFKFNAFMNGDLAVVEMTDGATGETIVLAQRVVSDMIEGAEFAMRSIREQFDEIG